MLHLIDDIIDLSKIEAGNLEISYSRCYINQMLIELQKSFKKIKSLNNKQDIGILVQLPIDDEHFSIMTDTVICGLLAGAKPTNRAWSR